MNNPRNIIDAFTEAISARNLDAISSMLTDDTKLVNKDGVVTEGKPEVLETWAAYFAKWPLTRFVFSAVNHAGKIFTIAGHTEAQHGVIDPMLWQAVVEGDQIYTWQAYESTPERVEAFGLDQ